MEQILISRLKVPVLVIALICAGIQLTKSTDELSLMQKRDCEVDLKKLGCTGITSTCEFVGSIVTCTCRALSCATKKSDIDISDNALSTTEDTDKSDGTPLGDFLFAIRQNFRLRYGIEGIGTTNGFLRLGFCKVPLDPGRNDVCFFMHWFMENGFKQLNIRFGHRVTNSSSASV